MELMETRDLKKVLILYDYFLPGHKAGGIVQSCANIIENLKENFYFYVITGSSDLGEKEPYPNVKIGEWNRLNNSCEVFYLSERSQIDKLMKSITYDVIYFNSIFSIKYTLWPLVIHKLFSRKKIVLSPRGMLQEGALQQKALKKRVFLKIFKTIGLHKGVIFHATDQQEEEDVRKIFSPKSKVFRISNFPAKYGNLWHKSGKKAGELKLVYISLITPKKNLIYLLKALKGINSSKIAFDIYGPIVDKAYWEECLKLMAELPSNIKVQYKNPLPHHQVFPTLIQYHFFVLPTLGENFGHAIIEALSAGRPVIISDKTPWKRLNQHKAGWALSLDKPTEFSAAIGIAAGMNEEEYNEWSQCSYSYAENAINHYSLVSSYRNLFSSL